MAKNMDRNNMKTCSKVVYGIVGVAGLIALVCQCKWFMSAKFSAPEAYYF
jgi:uncharacterized membrane protein YuzA (DUF378 family)